MAEFLRFRPPGRCDKVVGVVLSHLISWLGDHEQLGTVLTNPKILRFLVESCDASLLSLVELEKLRSYTMMTGVSPWSILIVANSIHPKHADWNHPCNQGTWHQHPNGRSRDSHPVSSNKCTKCHDMSFQTCLPQMMDLGWIPIPQKRCVAKEEVTLTREQTVLRTTCLS